jgi:DNA (cytosine-5)-methyltransferase 1
VGELRAVDLFAGWGGFTEGAEQAGARVVWAANHWPLAVRAHAANHPHVEHACQDLRQADWTALPAFDLLLASPACQGHSSAARGPRKASAHVRGHHDALRSTAWAVIDCAEQCRPRAIVVENVPDFASWALFDLWCEALQRLGYDVERRTIRASHHGVPQRRDRLFLFGTLDGRRVPELSRAPEPAFGPCIEWDAPAAWRSVVARRAVRVRVERSRPRHGSRFITQHTRDHMGVGLHEPIRTITTKDQWAVVDGDRYRSLTVRETARAMGFRDSYAWPSSATRKDAIRGLGNAVCPPVARAAVAAVMEALGG